MAEGDNTDLVLTLVAAPTPTSLATDDNAIAALTGLKKYQGINQSLLNVYNPALALNDTASANRAGAQLSPTATNSAASSALTAAYNPIPSAVNDRLDGIRVAQATGNNSKSSGSPLENAPQTKPYGVAPLASLPTKTNAITSQATMPTLLAS